MENNQVRGYGPLDNFIANLRHNIALKKLQQFGFNDSILDIGCGMYPYFLNKTSFENKVGLDFGDFASDVVDGVQMYNIDISKADSIPFEDNTFEVITMLAVFEHIEVDKVAGVCREINRILKPGGVFFMTTPTPWADGLLRFLAKIRLISSVEIDDHKDAYNIRDVEKYLSEAGFGLDKIQAGYFEFSFNLWSLAVK